MSKVKETIKRILVSHIFPLKVICIINKKMSIFKVGSITEYCENNGLILHMINPHTLRATRKQAPTLEDYINNSFELLNRPVSKSYIAAICGAKFIGETDGLFIENKYLFERIEWDKGGFFNYCPNNIVAICEKRCWFNKKDLIDRYIDSGIILLKMWSENIFHFTFEVIAKLIAVDRYCSNDVPILVDEIVKRDLRAVKLLEMANKSNREVIWIKSNERITVGKAILPPCMAWGTFDQNILNKEGHGWILDENSAKMIKNVVLKDYCPRRVYDKVYVARGNNDRLVNESELIEKLVLNGFEIFYPDKASFEDELDCFSTANCLVTCAGAAITNIVYCKDDINLYQICPFEFQCATGAPIEDVLDLKINKIAAVLVKKGQAMNLSSFRIREDDIERIVSESGSDK